MKKYLLIAFIGVLTVACDNSKDPFEEVNKAPEILVKKQSGTEFVELFTDSLKIETGSYSFSYKIEDEQRDLSGYVTCENINSKVSGEDQTVTVTPSELGETSILITTFDGFGKEANTRVNIIAFDNLPPVARIKVTESSQILSPLERKLDAKDSFDQDARFGGSIVEYEFRVENEAFIRTPKSYLDYIFPQPGSYLISLRVKDSNGAWSETSKLRYAVN